jgi:tRNA-binding EMAP/Myf-like protein
MSRKLATIRKIVAINPIEGADKIEVATVDSWSVVVKKGEFSVNDLCIYFEIDSFIPNKIAPFLTKEGKEPRTFMGIKGERLRTVKLRGQISQGLILPLDAHTIGLREGTDVTDVFDVVKYDLENKEEPEPKGLFATLMKNKLFRNAIGKYYLKLTKKKGAGLFPSSVSKTDEERVQNLTNSFNNYWKETSGWSVSEKLDGQSVSYYIENVKGWFSTKRELGVCSRNFKLPKPDGTSYWDVARRYEIKEKLLKHKANYAIQGEIIGPRIQANKYQRNANELYVFNVINLDTKIKLCNSEVVAFCKELGLSTVPYISFDTTLPKTIEELLSMADGQSVVYPTIREGLVFRKDNVSFKAISNKFLLKEAD